MLVCWRHMRWLSIFYDNTHFLRALCKLLWENALVQVCLFNNIPSGADVKFGCWFWRVLMMDCLESVSCDLWNSASLKPVFTGILKLLNLVTEVARETPSFNSVAVWRPPSHHALYSICFHSSNGSWIWNIAFIAIEKSLRREPYNSLFKGLTLCYVSQLSFNSDGSLGFGLPRPQLHPVLSGASNCEKYECRVRRSSCSAYCFLNLHLLLTENQPLCFFKEYNMACVCFSLILHMVSLIYVLGFFGHLLPICLHN